MNKKVLIGIVALATIILLAVVVIAMTRTTTNTTTTDDTTVDQSMNSDDSSGANPIETTEAPIASLTYADTGFNPSTLTVAKGTAITIANNAARDLMFASADHPTHQVNTELNIDMIKPGASGTVTITKTGTWGYHNHDNPSQTGQITVTE